MACQNCDPVQGAIKMTKAVLGIGRAAVEVSLARREICCACERLLPGPFFVARRCELCGCFAAAKTRLAAETCPANPPKWGPVGAPIQKP